MLPCVKKVFNLRAPLSTRMGQSRALVCIGGLPGVGKTTFGLGLLDMIREGAILVDPDICRLTLLTDGSDTIADHHLTPSLTFRTFDLMAANVADGLTRACLVVVPSTFAHGDQRDRFEIIAPACGATFHGLWLEAPLETHRRRLLDRAARRARGERDLTTVSAVIGASLDPTIVTGTIRWTSIDADRSAAEVLRDVADRLGLGFR